MIKIRAFNTKTQEMLSYNELLYEHNLKNVLKRPEQCDLIVMQYAGFKLQGEEIAEGDVIETESGRIQVVTKVSGEHEGNLFDGFYAYDDEQKKLMAFDPTDKLIGNVYDHPFYQLYMYEPSK